ncbi:hypothetical protein [Ostreibacterium oceani]|uniref:Phage tail protein n=1 Tax=Ostreibacterium oceani TaxID=2654998 RepID=A0A6N7EY89_9GAMM|nr:hypothetical protein [Ostreibacterium oceani]MPV86913.1 hypothetical protein [Ostreibacterium oceani]
MTATAATATATTATTTQPTTTTLAHEDEALDSVLYRATGSTRGIEALMMTDASLATIFLPAGAVVPTSPLAAAPASINTRWVNLWQ